ncbi:hypothetical protein ACFQ08_42455, partial [Streptosporangium algeriense]
PTVRFGLARLTGAVDEVLNVHGPGPVPLLGAEVAVNLHGAGPQSTTALLRTAPGRLLTHSHPTLPEVPGPAWRDDLHEVERWCALLEWYGIAADPTDLALPAPSIETTGAAKTAGIAGIAEPVRETGVVDTARTPGIAGSTETPGNAGSAEKARATETTRTAGDTGSAETSRNARVVGKAGVAGSAEKAGATETARTAGIAGGTGRMGHVIVHPGAAFPARRWPPQRFA